MVMLTGPVLDEGGDEDEGGELEFPPPHPNCNPSSPSVIIETAVRVIDRRLPRINNHTVHMESTPRGSGNTLR